MPGKPVAWDENSLATHYEGVEALLATPIDASAIFKKGLALAQGVHSSNDVETILALFPSKKIAGSVGNALGVNVGTLFNLLADALGTDEA